jgi:hypothetical protein
MDRDARTFRALRGKVRHDIWWAKLSMVKKKLDNPGTLEQRSFSTVSSTARSNETYGRPEALFREPDISSESQPRQALIDVHLESFTLILRRRVPKNVVLNEHKNSRTYGSGF